MSYSLNCELREDQGKGASRRLRREEGLVPAIVYGGRKKPVSITIPHKDLVKQLEDEGFYSQLITLNIGGKDEAVILKDLQRHPAKPVVMHADFYRVSKTKKLSKNVPLHFINEAASQGVKVEGGVVSHLASQIEISCLPADLPVFIEVDLLEVGAGSTVHISDLTLPKGVSSVALSHGADHDLPLVAINIPKGKAADSEEEGEAAAE